jgi:nitrite reductase/ring-hydroxylating ferredoxin subunit
MNRLFSLIYLVFLCACSGSSKEDENCKFLLDISINETIDLNLPQYSHLQFAGNSEYIPFGGNAGIIIASTGFDFFAWDASDPNHVPSACSALVPSGLEATCGCPDENKYSLVTGAPLENPSLRCSLKFYRVEKNGNILSVFN